MKKLLALFTILFFINCANTKTTVTKTKKEVQTLTEITVLKLDTTIFIPGEKVSLFIPIEKVVDAKGNFKQKTLKQVQRSGRSKVTVTIDSLGITATSNCDSIAQKLDFYKKEIKQLKLESTDTEVKTKTKKGYTFLELILYMVVTAIVSFAAAYLLKSFKII